MCVLWPVQVGALQYSQSLCTCRQRRHIAHTLADTERVIDTLERLVGCVLHVLAVFAYLAIFGMTPLDRTPGHLVKPAAVVVDNAAGLGHAGLECTGCTHAEHSMFQHGSLQVVDITSWSFAGVNVSHLVISLSSMVVAFAFVFGESLRHIYESVVFLFVVNPFEVLPTFHHARYHVPCCLLSCGARPAHDTVHV
jgi:hypothetical protein